MSASDGLGPLPEPVATIANDGHPRHIRHVWGAGETRLYGPPRGLYRADQMRSYGLQERSAERKRLAAEFTKRAEALNTTGAGCAPHIQAQYEAMAGELLDWAATLG